jgi:hypothetical protein
MSSLEKRIATAILNTIRARRKVVDTDGDLGVRKPGELPKAKVREALFSDFSAVAVLKERWGLAADSVENWERLWRRNPALAGRERDCPIGWVLEAGGAVVGYLGNISLLYNYGEQVLMAVASHGLVVEPEYRVLGLSLVRAFYSQPNTDLYLVTTAIPEVGRISRAFKSDPLPQPDYEAVLFWVLRPHSFAQVLFEKLGLNPTVARAGGIPASMAIGMDKLLRGRSPRGSSPDFTISEIGMDEIGDDFRSLWIEKLGEGVRLFADRSPATLRWHFEIPGDRGSARILCCRQNDKLLGYAVIRNDPQPNGLRKSIVADMLVKQDDEEVVKALLVAAYEHAKVGGSYVLEVMGFPSSIRNVCSLWNPYVRKYPACPFYYKAADPALHKKLSDGVAWYASPFDGDATLIRPSFSNARPARVFTASGNTTAPGASTERIRSEVV